MSAASPLLKKRTITFGLLHLVCKTLKKKYFKFFNENKSQIKNNDHWYKLVSQPRGIIKCAVIKKC